MLVCHSTLGYIRTSSFAIAYGSQPGKYILFDGDK